MNTQLVEILIHASSPVFIGLLLVVVLKLKKSKVEESMFNIE
jgi:hypothetical protein